MMVLKICCGCNSLFTVSQGVTVVAVVAVEVRLSDYFGAQRLCRTIKVMLFNILQGPVFFSGSCELLVRSLPSKFSGGTTMEVSQCA
jgi:hypothetical protein